MNILAYAACAVILASAGSALAQPTDANPPNAGRLRLAHELVQAMGGEAAIAASLRLSLDAVPDDAKQSAEDAKSEKDSRDAAILGLVPAATEVSAQIYASTFDEKQLGELIAYYRAPANQAATAKAAALTDRTAISLIVVMDTLKLDLLQNACAKIACTGEQQSALEASRPSPPPKRPPADPLKDGYD